MSYDNALALNDLFYYTTTSDLGGGAVGPRGSGGAVIHYSVPFGNWTMGTTNSTSQYYQTVVGLNQPYIYSGTTENNEVKVTRLMFRDAKQKLNLSMRAFQRKSKNYIDDTEIYVQRRVVGGWDSTLNHKVFVQDATVESNVTYKRGTGAFGSMSAAEDNYAEGTSRFAVVMADVNHLSGAVVGVRGYLKKLSYDFFIATPLTKPDHFNTPGSTAGFSLTASF